MMMIWCCIALTFFEALTGSVGAERLEFTPEGIFRILHLSDVHYRVNEESGASAPPCRDVSGDPHSSYCTVANTTDFITRLIEIENPQMVVHTGDIIDGDTHSAADGMNSLYGVAIKANLKWAATLGNHDDDSDLTRPEVMDYILSLDAENNLSQNNPLGVDGDPTESYGNFHLEIFDPRDGETSNPAFRTYHLDSNTNNASVNQEQVEWFIETAKEFSGTKVPAMLFTHVPMQEYSQAALRPESGLCGKIREQVSSGTENSGLFEALVADGSVKATFVGHDHTNDYCGSVSGLQMCYEGSPGYQGYGHCNIRRDACYIRRARVTTITNWGGAILSHKRLDNWPETEKIDSQILWAKDSETAAKFSSYDTCIRSGGTAENEGEYERLPQLSQSTSTKG